MQSQTRLRLNLFHKHPNTINIFYELHCGRRRCVNSIDCGPPLPDWIRSRKEEMPAIQCFTEESANFRRVFVPLSRRGAKTNDNRIRLKYILQRIFTHTNFSGVGRSTKCGPPSAGRLLRQQKTFSIWI